MSVTTRARTAVIATSMVAATSFVGIGLGAAPADAAAAGAANGNYTVTYQWSGSDPSTFVLTLMGNHQFVGGGGSGTYTYRSGKLKFTFTSNDCGTVYKGTGTPSSGFSGTSIINNSASDCLAQGTTGLWSSGAKGAVATGTRTLVHASGLR